MKIVTHSGTYHADDVFAVAALLLLYPDAEVARSRDPEVINSADIVVDVGREHNPARRRFDHHQEGGAGVRPNGIPYASFGLVWKEFGEKLAGSKEAWELIEERLAMPIDALDNGMEIAKPVVEHIRPYSISDFLYSFLSHDNATEMSLYETFMKVVKLTKELLAREIDRAKEVITGMEEVKKILDSTEDKGVIIFDKELPWPRVLVPHPGVLFVVSPRKEGDWGVRSVRVKLDGFEFKKLLPLEWAGKVGQELENATGVPGATFCHRGRFLIVVKDKEGAIKLAYKALEI
ncbi:MAG: MYG1 family protein [bacterium]|nr:MYG1 family protein [bacterium]